MMVLSRLATAPTRCAVVGSVWLAALLGSIVIGPSASADPPNPSDAELIRPLPAFTPIAKDWAPEVPFPYDQTLNRVTPQDITAMSEMCQWYNAQYDTLNDQISRLQFNRIGPDGRDYDYTRGDLQSEVDIVIGNIEQSLAFLSPRANVLSQPRNFAGDVYFAAYKGDAFYGLWQQLSNVMNGINAHQPDWFTGPSLLRFKKWGSEIHRSDVCE